MFIKNRATSVWNVPSSLMYGMKYGEPKVPSAINGNMKPVRKTRL